MVGTKHCLSVYLSHEPIATLSVANDRINWQYSIEWQQKGFPLSPHLPLDNVIPSENTERFLRNLLPEGDGLGELLSSFNLSKYNTFGLINALGLDIPGALIVRTEGQSIPKQPVFRPIADTELEERLKHRQEYGLIIWDGKPRLSSAGVQDKINVFINENEQMGFGEGSLCSTHILKFEKRKLSHLVLNEFITMRLAQACELPVAKVKLKYFGAFPSLLVERFDRKLLPTSGIRRHHIVDGCQALNLPPEYKYERIYGNGRDVAHIREGASYIKLFEFADKCLNPALTKIKMIDWALFNALVFNCDAHGKNISFFVDNNGIELAPFYDLVNIKMYPNFEQEMAMAFGDEFDNDSINAYQIADFADSCHLNRSLVTRRLQKLATKLSIILANDFSLEFKKETERDYYTQYKSLVQKRCDFLLGQSEIINSIEL